MPIKEVSSYRWEVQERLSPTCINNIASNANVEVLQIRTPIPSDSWKLINQLAEKRPDIQTRLYGFYTDTCDLNVLKLIPSVENLAIDCLPHATNTDCITELRKLNALALGIRSLDNFDFLQYLPDSMEKLSLAATQSKKPTLEHLVRFKNLKRLYIEGHHKNLEVIGELNALEDLTLRSITTKDLSFVRKLNNLWSLDIKLGGTNDLSALEGLSNLKYLELWQIRGLSDISVISSLHGLQYLFLQSLRNVTHFPDLSELNHLRRVYLETMRGLNKLEGLFKAPKLEEFIHVCAQNMTPEQYQPLLDMPTMKKALFGFGSDKKNHPMEAWMKAKGIQRYKHKPFIYK